MERCSFGAWLGASAYAGRSVAGRGRIRGAAASRQSGCSSFRKGDPGHSEAFRRVGLSEPDGHRFVAHSEAALRGRCQIAGDRLCFDRFFRMAACRVRGIRRCGRHFDHGFDRADHLGSDHFARMEAGCRDLGSRRCDRLAGRGSDRDGRLAGTLAGRPGFGRFARMEADCRDLGSRYCGRLAGRGFGTACRPAGISACRLGFDRYARMEGGCHGLGSLRLGRRADPGSDRAGRRADT